jgi:hypothetical protein
MRRAHPEASKAAESATETEVKRMIEERDVRTKQLALYVGKARFETFPAKDGWRWHVTQRKRITATSGESFSSRQHAERAMRAFIKSVTGA